MKFILRALALCALLLTGCGEEAPQRHAVFALGTLVEISVFDPPPQISTALHATEAVLLAEEQRWRAWDGGELAALNARLAAGERVAIAPELRAGIERAARIANLSGHRFNPAIGRLVAAWEFHVEERTSRTPPDASALAELLPSPGMNALQFHGDGTVSSSDARLWIDMGAFAKGLAVESAIDTLRAHGIYNAIVNAGGDMQVIGQRGPRPWRIGVRRPRGDGVLAALDAQPGESIFTSGDYERFFEFEGTRYHHILDPATGQPARDVVSVTIVHADPALADAAATALFVAGRAHWRALARALGVELAMLVFDDGSIELTEAMNARITFEDSSAMARVR